MRQNDQVLPIHDKNRNGSVFAGTANFVTFVVSIVNVLILDKDKLKNMSC